ncbi:hypothetical protein HDU96_003627 [Phlyctochytrium bullatum]|nr:hypothetical protein HDU96_003627 [Phlyctochytrium bullatum]
MRIGTACWHIQRPWTLALPITRGISTLITVWVEVISKVISATESSTTTDLLPTTTADPCKSGAPGGPPSIPAIFGASAGTLLLLLTVAIFYLRRSRRRPPATPPDLSPVTIPKAVLRPVAAARPPKPRPAPTMGEGTSVTSESAYGEHLFGGATPDRPVGDDKLAEDPPEIEAEEEGPPPAWCAQDGDGRFEDAVTPCGATLEGFSRHLYLIEEPTDHAPPATVIAVPHNTALAMTSPLIPVQELAFDLSYLTDCGKACLSTLGIVFPSLTSFSRRHHLLHSTPLAQPTPLVPSAASGRRILDVACRPVLHALLSCEEGFTCSTILRGRLPQTWTRWDGTSRTIWTLPAEVDTEVTTDLSTTEVLPATASISTLPQQLPITTYAEASFPGLGAPASQPKIPAIVGASAGTFTLLLLLAAVILFGRSRGRHSAKLSTKPEADILPAHIAAMTVTGIVLSTATRLSSQDDSKLPPTDSNSLIRGAKSAYGEHLFGGRIVNSSGLDDKSAADDGEIEADDEVPPPAYGQPAEGEVAVTGGRRRSV